MKEQSVFLFALLVAGILLVQISPVSAQLQMDEKEIWEAFKAWVLSGPAVISLKAYAEELEKGGSSQEEIRKQLDTIRRIYTDYPEKGVELTYDQLFSKPLTGDPEKDGFTSTPSMFMMESAEGLEPATALDIGAGQGRNAVWLAQQGWEVTGIDISGVGLSAAADNAEKAGVRINTVKTSYQDFDYGIEQWDLIVMILSWAPVSDPAFIARLERSLRPGGSLIFEHVLETEKQTFPPVVQAVGPNALLSYFKDFHIQKYEEGVWLGDWGGPPAELVRMIAKKRPYKK